MSHATLTDEADGLLVQLDSDQAKDRFRLLAAFLTRYSLALRRSACHFIDLKAGAGKRKFSPSGAVLRTPPLVALTSPQPFQRLWLAEANTPEYEALQQRVQSSERAAQAELFHGDGSELLPQVVASLRASDASLRLLAYLDAEALGLPWDVLETLASPQRGDFLIDLSKVGWVKGDNVMYDKSRQERFDRFFGTAGWRKPYQRTGRMTKHQTRQALLAFYRERLMSLGLVQTRLIEDAPRRYQFLFASPHNPREKLWSAALREIRQLRLF